MPVFHGLGWLAPVYDRMTRGLEERWLSGWRRRAFEAVPSTGTGLEIGAGTGTNFRLHPPDAFVVATDLSGRMIAEASSKRGPAGPELVVCDAMALPFRDAAFDWVLETLVFCEVPDPIAGLREVRRVLKPGGRVVMLEHVRPGGWRGRVADLLTLLTSPLWGEHFDRDPIASARSAGLEVESVVPLRTDAVLLLTLVRPKA